jgi:hypothetical protein
MQSMPPAMYQNRVKKLRVDGDGTRNLSWAVTQRARWWRSRWSGVFAAAASRSAQKRCNQRPTPSSGSASNDTSESSRTIQPRS